MRGTEDFFVSPILQETALGVVTSAAWERHLRKLRAALTQWRAALIGGLEGIGGWERELHEGPLHVWLTAPPGADPDALRDAALRHGVAIVSGTNWHPSDPPTRHLRLSSAAAPVPQIQEGLRRLNRALRALQG